MLMKSKRNRSALVVEGGGMRSLFSAGVLNAFGEEGFDPFDMYFGVSAGACNLASHLAGQNSRNYDICVRYSSTPNFISLGRFLSGGHYMDLDWLWDSTINNYRLDLKTIFRRLRARKKKFIIVATSMETGNALYLNPTESTLEHYLKVSSALPILYRSPLEVGSERAIDGGIADSIPVMEAFRRGATDITVIRSRPSGYVKKRSRFSFLLPLFFRKYPRFIESFEKRPDTYMEAVRFIHNPPTGIRISEIAPPADVPIGRATRDLGLLYAAYQTGIKHGREHIQKHG